MLLRVSIKDEKSKEKKTAMDGELRKKIESIARNKEIPDEKMCNFLCVLTHETLVFF